MVIVKSQDNIVATRAVLVYMLSDQHNQIAKLDLLIFGQCRHAYCQKLQARYAVYVLQHSPNQAVNGLRLLLQDDHGFLHLLCQVLSPPLQFSCPKDHAPCNITLSALACSSRLGKIFQQIAHMQRHCTAMTAAASDGECSSMYFVTANRGAIS